MTRLVTSSLSLVVFFLVIVLPTPASASSDDPVGTYLSFEERVSCREAVEDVIWSHRIWPEENPGPKPARHEIKSHEQVAANVADSLLYEAALTEIWGESLTAERVQGELDRIGRETKRPEILLEIFAALDNDPLLVAECFVRPQLGKRLVREHYDLDATPAMPESRSPREFSAWWADARRELVPFFPEPASFTLPSVIKCRYCNDDGWTPAPGLPHFELSDRRDHTAVWTGTEMIIWGGESSTGIKTDTGGRYDPITDTWTPMTTTGAPSERRDHTAVWTGTEMIVWGGWDTFFINNGGRYNPDTDTWTTVSNTGAAVGCVNHSAVWTGSEMIVWGGTDSSYAKIETGGRYDPTTDSWTATTTTGAPVARDKHHAFWIGTEMIVWGGQDASHNETNTGGRYDPATDSWTATSTVGPPSARYGESAVWTGTEMIIWGGRTGTPTPTYLNDGARLTP